MKEIKHGITTQGFFKKNKKNPTKQQNATQSVNKYSKTISKQQTKKKKKKRLYRIPKTQNMKNQFA